MGKSLESVLCGEIVYMVSFFSESLLVEVPLYVVQYIALYVGPIPSVIIISVKPCMMHSIV